MLISFVVPVYNAQMYLHECICSILSQTYENIELILVDDGSTDKSGEICDSYGANDIRVKVIHQQNGGVHTARNVGMAQAGGEYILFVDSDDWIDKNTVKNIVDYLLEDPVDIFRFNYVREFEDRSLPKVNSFVPKGKLTGDQCRLILRQTLGLVREETAHPENFNFLATACTCAYRRKLIVENNLAFEDRRPIGSFEDGLFNLQVLQFAKSFYYEDKCFYHYRKTNDASCTAGYRKALLDKQLLLFSKLEKYINKHQNDDFKIGYANRVIFSTLELSLNALRNPTSHHCRYQEVRTILNSKVHKEAYKSIELQYYPLKWKVYFWMAKHRITGMVYLMTRAILALQKRGKSQ